MTESNNTTPKNKRLIVSIVLILIIIVSLAASGLFLFPKASNQPTTAVEVTEEYQELNCEDESSDMLASVVNNTTDEDCVFAGCGEFFQ